MVASATLSCQCCTSHSQWEHLDTNTGSQHGKLRTQMLSITSIQKTDDNNPFQTNLWVEGWSCAWAANKVHKEGPILKASEEVGPLMATATRSWRKANTRLCKYEMTTERKYEENANPRPRRSDAAECTASGISHTHILTFSLCNKALLFLGTDAFPKFLNPHWSEANWNCSLPSILQRRKSWALKYGGFHLKYKTEIQKPQV